MRFARLRKSYPNTEYDFNVERGAGYEPTSMATRTGFGAMNTGGLRVCIQVELGVAIMCYNDYREFAPIEN